METINCYLVFLFFRLSDPMLRYHFILGLPETASEHLEEIPGPDLICIVPHLDFFSPKERRKWVFLSNLNPSVTTLYSSWFLDIDFSPGRLSLLRGYSSLYFAF